MQLCLVLVLVLHLAGAAHLAVSISVLIDGLAANVTAVASHTGAKELQLAARTAAHQFCQAHSADDGCIDRLGRELHTRLLQLARTRQASAGHHQQEAAERWLWYVPRPGGAFNQLDQLWEFAQLSIAVNRRLVLPIVAPSVHGLARAGIPFEALWSADAMTRSLSVVAAAAAAAAAAAVATGVSATAAAAEASRMPAAGTTAQFVHACSGVVDFLGASGFNRRLGTREARYPSLAGVVLRRTVLRGGELRPLEGPGGRLAICPGASMAGVLRAHAATDAAPCLGLSYAEAEEAGAGSHRGDGRGEKCASAGVDEPHMISPRFLTALQMAGLPPFSRACPNVAGSGSQWAARWGAAAVEAQAHGVEGEVVRRSALQWRREWGGRELMAAAWSAAAIGLRPRAELAQTAQQVLALLRSIDSSKGCGRGHRIVAAHVRLGDFEQHCASLAQRSGSAALDGCWPSASEIVQSVHAQCALPQARACATAECSSSSSCTTPNLPCRVLVFTNPAAADSLAAELEVAAAARPGGASGMSFHTLDRIFSVGSAGAVSAVDSAPRWLRFALQALSAAERLAVEQALMQWADGFVGNAFSSLSGVVFHQRLLRGADVDVWRSWDHALPHWNMSSCPLWAERGQPRRK